MIRHIGFYVYDIDKVGRILERLGFFKVYDEIEHGKKIKKYKNDQEYKIELIEDITLLLEVGNQYHISFDGEVPDFMLEYEIAEYKANDPNLKVFFVYIDDTIYFEFVSNK